jgi:polyphosphate kinase
MTDPADPPSASTGRYTNRELSWLDFNSRVLAMAEDTAVPVLERLRFCSIYASNLDEFFMVRVAGLKDQIAARLTQNSPDGLTPAGQLHAIRREVAEQVHRLERVHVDRLLPALADAGIEIREWQHLGPDDRAAATNEFEQRIFPILTPLAVDPGHPFPYISNLSLNLAVQVTDLASERRRFARLKVPDTLPRFLTLPSGTHVLLEQVIAAHLDALFPGMAVAGSWPFRVTRNADLTLNDEDADDLLEAVELELRRRRFGRAIRLEIDHTMPADTRELLLRELDLDEEDVFRYRGLLDCTGFAPIIDLDEPDLRYPPYGASTANRLRDVENSADFFGRIREGDILLHHPYDSFNSSVSDFVGHASRDPHVRAIKLTLYRTSGDSPILESLIRAAESGKQVAVLVEVKARFDERVNIQWARRLEEAGVHVAYGLVGLKIHTKTSLVVRSESDGLRRYCHIGTGNYNPGTARFYEDIGLLTSDPEIGDDLTQLFNFLTGYGRNVVYKNLLVAPRSLRPALRVLIDSEVAAGPGRGRIFLKMNGLVDIELIDRLYAASQAGVSIDLVVRGICSLRPGIPELSENIRVRSIVGKYLEHSRIYYFGNADGLGQPGYFMGSADLMPRNLDRRVEAVVRLKDPAAQQRIQEIIDANLTDDQLSWVLGPDGAYTRLGGDTFQLHDYLQGLAVARNSEDLLDPDRWSDGAGSDIAPA